MEFVFSVFFIASVAFVLTSAQHSQTLQDQYQPPNNLTDNTDRNLFLFSNQTIHIRYHNLITKFEEIESKYEKLPGEKEQLHSTIAHSILRLSAHLKNNFDELAEQALQRICYYQGGYSNCHGSTAYQKGVTKVCLYADTYSFHQLGEYRMFTDCLDDILKHVVHNREIGSSSMRELDLNIANLKMEYRDVNNRFELEMVLDYYEKIINDNIELLLQASERIENFDDSLNEALSYCYQNGFPRLRSTVFQISSVTRCIEDFLLQEIGTSTFIDRGTTVPSITTSELPETVSTSRIPTTVTTSRPSSTTRAS